VKCRRRREEDRLTLRIEAGPPRAARALPRGLRTIADLASANLDDLVRAGVRRDLAAQVRAYVRRRLQ